MLLRVSKIALIAVLLTCDTSSAQHEEQSDTPWPPALPGEKAGTVTLATEEFLAIPASVAEVSGAPDVVPFVVAKQHPTVDFAYHRDLGEGAVNRRLWSSWGDICVASDGAVYCAIGDHGDDVGGDARCFIYRWNPQSKQLDQVVDMNRIVPAATGQPAWSKVHAKLAEGQDGAIYFSCTLNDGNRAVDEKYKWNERLPGGQIYRYDPRSGKTTVFANLPAKRCTATSLLDRERGVWWCNLEGGGNALWGLDLKTKQVVCKAPDGSMAFNRAFALTRDGSIYFNGEGGIWKYDATTGKMAATGVVLPDSPGMRAVSAETREGILFGATHGTNQLFRFDTRKQSVKLLGPTFLKGEYTTVTILSPDERFLYYLPGAHGKAWQYGTPVIQYELATGRRKVLAFLAEAISARLGYVPGGTYGVKLSADGSTLYVNFNGHAADKQRPKQMKPNGFGLCGFMAIQIPESER